MGAQHQAHAGQQRGHQSLARRQRGLSLLSLLFWAAIIGFLVVLLLRVTPTVMEFYTIKSTIDRIARDNPGTVGEARSAFDRVQQVEYSIVSVKPNDLIITKEGERVKISFAYDKEVGLFGPVSLLIKYHGESR